MHSFSNRLLFFCSFVHYILFAHLIRMCLSSLLSSSSSQALELQLIPICMSVALIGTYLIRFLLSDSCFGARRQLNMCKLLINSCIDASRDTNVERFVIRERLIYHVPFNDHCIRTIRCSSYLFDLQHRITAMCRLIFGVDGKM